MIRKQLLSAALTAVVGTLLNSPVWAAGERACEPFTAFSPADQRMVHFSDMDEDGGLSAGDKRVGHRLVHDADGNKIGDVYWTQTVHEVDEQGTATRRSVERISVFADGVIFASYEPDPYDKVHVTEQPSLAERTHPFVIVGGTGAYAEARGTIELTSDGLENRYEFKLTCN